MDIFNKILSAFESEVVPDDPRILYWTGIHTGRRITAWMRFKEWFRAWQNRNEKLVAFLIVASMVGAIIINALAFMR